MNSVFKIHVCVCVYERIYALYYLCISLELVECMKNSNISAFTNLKYCFNCL